MATDWLFYWMTEPSGLALIGLAVAIPFLFWRLVLGHSFAGVGFMPLVIAYACAGLGLLLACFLSSYVDFSSRVSSGGLQESQRWSIVPGWTIYAAVLSLIYVLPLLGIVGVPLSALLLRTRKLTYVTIAAATVTLWLVLALVMWWAPPTTSGSRHIFLKSLTTLLKELLPGIVLVAGPFLLAIYGASRSSSMRDPDTQDYG